MSNTEYIKKKYPEGLCGIFVFGGTRTSYATQIRRHATEPGAIESFQDYTEYGLTRSLEIIHNFFELGGKYAILEILDIHRIAGERGAYTNPAIDANYALIDEKRQQFYLENQIDPYFVGIDALLQLSESHLAYKLAKRLQEFQMSWSRDEAHCKLIYSIAPLPLYTFSKIQFELLSDEDNLLNLANKLYRQFSVASYGLYVPPPAFYIGQARNGSMQSASRLPLALDVTGKLRLYYTQYPSFYLSKTGLKTILDDLLYESENGLNSKTYDYNGQITPEMAHEMHEYFSRLADDGESILGLRHPWPAKV